MVHHKWSIGVFVCLAICVLSLPSCRWEDAYSDKAFLHSKYALDSYADIQGQDPMTYIFFGDYHGIQYPDLFDTSFERSYLDMKVEIDNGQAVGIGRLLLTYATGEVFLDWAFHYWCTSEYNNYQGRVMAEGSLDCLGEWVYCIYWCRLQIECIVPESDTPILLTFNFRGGEGNPVPSEFQVSASEAPDIL